MSTRSTIEWTCFTWNVIVGCAKVSAGCLHCYAERMSNRLAGMGRARTGSNERTQHYTKIVGPGGHWNNRVELVPEALEDPLHLKKPSRIFVNSMSDTLHNDVRIYPTMKDGLRCMLPP